MPLYAPLVVTGLAHLRLEVGRHVIVDGFAFRASHGSIVAHEVVAAGTAQVEAWGFVRVVATECARVTAHAFVFAHGTAKVLGLEGSVVWAFGASEIRARRECIVRVFEGAQVDACENSLIVIPRLSQFFGSVRLRGNARLVDQRVKRNRTVD